MDHRALRANRPRKHLRLGTRCCLLRSLAFAARFWHPPHALRLVFFALHAPLPHWQSFLYCAANLPGNVIVLYLIGKVGRKPLMLGSMLTATLFAVAFAFVATDTKADDDNSDGSNGDDQTSGSGPNAALVIVAAMGFNAACTAAWDVINVVSTEVFPTHSRATALGALAAAGRLGSIGAQFVNGALQSSVPRLLSVTACAMLAGAVAILGLSDRSAGSLAD